MHLYFGWIPSSPLEAVVVACCVQSSVHSSALLYFSDLLAFLLWLDFVLSDGGSSGVLHVVIRLSKIVPSNLFHSSALLYLSDLLAFLLWLDFVLSVGGSSGAL